MPPSINLELPENLRQFVEAEALASGCTTPADYLLRLVAEAREQKVRDHVDRLIEEGLSSGEPLPVDEAFWAERQRRLQSR